MTTQLPLPPDRLLLQALTAGVEELVADPTLFGRLAAGWPAAELSRLQARFLARRPAVRPAFARKDDPFPTWNVALSEERPERELVGAYLGVDEAMGAHGASELGGLEEQLVAVYLCCEHPEEARLHHQLAKGIVRDSLRWLLEQGVVSVGYEGARDLRPDEQYLPETVWARLQSWRMVVPSVAYELRGPHPDRVFCFFETVDIPGHPGRRGGVQPAGE